ncbi:hypothetical protein IAU59_002961 [Kwoniella sp. CBS 9459]
MSPVSSTSTGQVGSDNNTGYQEGSLRDHGHGYEPIPSQSQLQSQSESESPSYHPEGGSIQDERFYESGDRGTGNTPIRGPVKRPRQACTNCRALKTRCLPYGGGSMKSKDTCSRCAKYGLKCDYERKLRGKANDADDHVAAPDEKRSSSTFSASGSSPRRTNTADYRPHWRVDEVEERSRRHQRPADKYGQRMDRNDRMGLSMAANVHEPGPSSWAAPPQIDIKPLPGLAPQMISYQSQEHSRPSDGTQLPTGLFNSGQPPTFFDVGNRTHSMGSSAVPTYVTPQDQPSSQPFSQQVPLRQESATYGQPMHDRARKPSRPIDHTTHESMPSYHQTPSVTNSSTRSSIKDPRAHVPSTYPPAGGTYVRSRKTEISTLITDHLDPHLGRGDSRSPSPVQVRRNSTYDHPTSSTRSSRVQSRTSLATDPGSTRNPSVRRFSNVPARVTVHPIDLGMVSEPEARYLFNQFFSHLSDIIACFDPKYTTYERVRSSPSLFTAMLFASARFFRPDLSPTLRSHAEVLVNRAVTEGLFDLPTIQALLVLAYWKLPKDGTAYIKLGIAIRGACQLRLWKKRTGPLPQNEEEARAVLDRERTWMCMDRAYSHIFEQPVMVPNSELQLTDGETWAFEHEHLNITVDWYLAWHACIHAPMDSVPMQRVDNDDESSQPPSNDAISPEVYLLSSTNKWANGPYLSECHGRMAYIITTMMILNIRSVTVQMNPNEKTIDDLICCAEDLADRLAVLADLGVLPYWSETGGAGISLSGSLLYKSRTQINNTQIDRIIILLQRFIQICNTPFDEEEDHALHYIQRFYRRLIPVFQDLQRGNKESEQVQQHVPPNPMVFTQQQTSVSAPWDQLMGVSSTVDPQWTMLWGFDMSSLPAQNGTGINTNDCSNNLGHVLDTNSFAHDGAAQSLGSDVNYGSGQGGNPAIPLFMPMSNLPTH